jgi:hypothetical protein
MTELRVLPLADWPNGRSNVFIPISTPLINTKTKRNDASFKALRLQDSE